MNETVFFALLPDFATHNPIVRRMPSTCRKYGFAGRPISADRLHISLFGLGEYDPQITEAACQIAGTIKQPSFEVRFDRALSFKNSKPQYPFVLTGDEGLAKLKEFARRFSAAFGVKLSSFTPHLTLIWDRRQIEPHYIQPVSWTVREFVLVKSFVGQSRYEILGRWPLETVPTSN